jgi:predicted lipid-binding transport protein (Tim44 family)
LLIIVLVIFFRLRGVLGMRDEDDGEDSQKSSRFKMNDAALGAQANVKKPTLRVVENEPVAEPLEDEPYDGGIVRGLARFKALEPHFDEAGFLQGAQRAYEMILKDFAAGDRDALRPLLTEEVYNGFVAAIDAREASGEKLVTQVSRMAKPVIDDVLVENNMVNITIRFVAYIASGLEGEDIEAARTEDLWTFVRPLGSSDPNWQLSATETV